MDKTKSNIKKEKLLLNKKPTSKSRERKDASATFRKVSHTSTMEELASPQRSPLKKSTKNWRKIQNVIKSALSLKNFEEDVFYQVVFRLPDAKITKLWSKYEIQSKDLFPEVRIIEKLKLANASNQKKFQSLQNEIAEKKSKIPGLVTQTIDFEKEKLALEGFLDNSNPNADASVLRRRAEEMEKVHSSKVRQEVATLLAQQMRSMVREFITSLSYKVLKMKKCLHKSDEAFIQNEEVIRIVRAFGNQLHRLEREKRRIDGEDSYDDDSDEFGGVSSRTSKFSLSPTSRRSSLFNAETKLQKQIDLSNSFFLMFKWLFERYNLACKEMKRMSEEPPTPGRQSPPAR